MNIPALSVWTPKITLMNSASSDNMVFADDSSNVLVFYFGWLLWQVPKRFVAACPLNLANFPFDTQTCTLKFMSFDYAWGTTIPAVYLTTSVSYVVTELYIESGEFILVNTSINCTDNKTHPLNQMNSAFPIFNVQLEYKRKTSYYFWNLILPAFLLTSELL